jgi:heme-degrading monooxygenase HmoA
MEAMFVTVNHIPARGEAGPALEARFRARQRMVDQLPGFRSFELLRPREEGEYLVMTSWATRADFEAWRTSPQQRPVRPAHAGHLSQPDEQSWPTFHETHSELRSADWPPPDNAALTIEVADAAPSRVDLVEGCVSIEVLRSLEGNWLAPDDAPGPAFLVLRRWAGQPQAGSSARTYDILQPSYAGQPAATQ